MVQNHSFFADLDLIAVSARFFCGKKSVYLVALLLNSTRGFKIKNFTVEPKTTIFLKYKQVDKYNEWFDICNKAIDKTNPMTHIRASNS